jgi:hypothetical protein
LNPRRIWAVTSKSSWVPLPRPGRAVRLPPRPRCLFPRRRDHAHDRDGRALADLGRHAIWISPHSRKPLVSSLRIRVGRSARAAAFGPPAIVRALPAPEGTWQLMGRRGESAQIPHQGHFGGRVGVAPEPSRLRGGLLAGNMSWRKAPEAAVGRLRLHVGQAQQSGRATWRYRREGCARPRRSRGTRPGTRRRSGRRVPRPGARPRWRSPAEPQKATASPTTLSRVDRLRVSSFTPSSVAS